VKAFQANMARLEGSDTQVLGVSVDSPFANHAFALENGITFPLLGDMDAKAIRDYGLLKEYKIGGVTINSARRATFLIDKQGKVIEVQADNEAVDPTKIIDACEVKAPAKTGTEK
jgi:peroxiredoxin